MTDTSGKLRLVDPSTGREFDFGTVTDISETFQKSVSVTPIVTRTKQDAFPIETRTYKQITVSFTRRSPLNPSDSSSDISKWSNGSWTKALMASLDRWQARTDGYQLYFKPSSDNPHVAPIRGASGTSFESGYVRNLDLKHAKGRPEVITGTFEFHVGTMRVKTSIPAEGGYDRRDFFIALSDANRSGDIILLRLGTEDEEINLVESCEVTSGPETPFEYAQVRIKRKALSSLYSGYADSSSVYDRIKAGRNRLIISLAGTSTMTVTKVKLTNTTLTLTAYCEAERIKGYTISNDLNQTPEGWITRILTTGAYGMSFASSDIVRSFSSPSAEKRYLASENLDLRFTKGTNVWYILQVAAMVCGARVFFAGNKAYIVDYRTSSTSVHPTEVDLYDGSGYTGAVVGNVDLGDEGMDTVANTVRIRCSSPKTSDGRYVKEGEDIACETIEYIVKDDGSIAVYGGERDGGLFYLDSLRQNGNSDELVYNGSPAKKDEEGSDTHAEGESGSTGQEGGTAGELVEDGVTEFFEQARRFGSNYLDYVSEAQQTVKFTLRELAGSGAGSWCPFFEPAALASKIIDNVDDIYVDNSSEDGGSARYQKLALKTVTRQYPECTSEYTWGVLASMDLSSNTSRIMSAQSAK